MFEDPKEKKSANLILHTLETPKSQVVVWQRPIDGYINVTQICQAAGKQFGHWREQSRVEEYLQELSSDIGIPISALIVSHRGGDKEQRKQQSTWAHPRIALRIAQWCSPRFEVQVDKWLEAWLKGDIGADINTRHLVRMLLYPTASPWTKTFSNDFYHELARLYNLNYNPKKGPPAGQARGLTDRLIYSRFPKAIREQLKASNPVIDSIGRRKDKNHQFLKPELAGRLDDLIASCTALMKIFHNKDHFEATWDVARPKEESHQMLLFAPSDILRLKEAS